MSMATSKPTYTPLNPSNSELDTWHEDPEQSSIEERNHRISIHRRPGFYSKSLLLSVGLNAMLLMLVAWLWLGLRRYVVIPHFPLAPAIWTAVSRFATCHERLG